MTRSCKYHDRFTMWLFTCVFRFKTISNFLFMNWTYSVKSLKKKKIKRRKRLRNGGCTLLGASVHYMCA